MFSRQIAKWGQSMFKTSTSASFAHGVHPNDYKQATAQKAIERLPFPKSVTVPLSQHAGKPSISLVHANQEVVRGEPIAKADGFVSVPQHAPVTGRVRCIDLMPSAKGERVPSIVIDSYAGDSQEVGYQASLDYESMSRDEIIKAVQNAGLVGLGGAAFPTHVKMSPPDDHVIDTILLNGCECEPFLTTDHRMMLEHTEDLFRGISLLQKVFSCEKVLLGIEDNKPDVVEHLQVQGQKLKGFAIKVLESKYPQGAEKMMAKAMLGREIPPGQYPSSVGLAVFNVATTAQMGELIPEQRGLIERVVTVTGPGIVKPGNYRVPIGTPVSFILNQLGVQGSEQHIIMGGPMMGQTLASLEAPITKGCGGILVLNENLWREDAEAHPCIGCGHCVDACPMHLNPSELGKLGRKHFVESMMNDYHLADCFECGCCSYVCPSRIPLVQVFRASKALARKGAM